MNFFYLERENVEAAEEEGGVENLDEVSNEFFFLRGAVVWVVTFQLNGRIN